MSPLLELFGHGAMTDLSPFCAPRRTSADHSEFMITPSWRAAAEGRARGGNGTNERVICPTGCLCDFVSSPISKNISFLGLVETAIQLAHPVPIRGAFRDRHGRWVRDAVDVMRRSAIFCAGERRITDGEVVWS